MTGPLSTNRVEVARQVDGQVDAAEEEATQQEAEPLTENHSGNLFNALDCLFGQLCTEPWHGSLSFPMDKGATGNITTVDLCNYFKKSRRDAGYVPQKSLPIAHKATRLYFPPTDYPPPTVDAESNKLHTDCQAYNKLKLALQSAAYSCGCPIVSNGSTKGTCKDRVFVCAFRHRVYRTGKTVDGLAK